MLRHPRMERRQAHDLKAADGDRVKGDITQPLEFH